ncbi:MAG TPA: amidohydrolase family protein [Microcoleus sp.]|nr:amidohydrolase family protein [Microcoleus sp.]
MCELYNSKCFNYGSGIAPILKYRKAGVNVSFGCDGAASNDSQDLLEAIKIGSILHKITDLDYRQWITPRQSVDMASLGGAKGLNAADEIGSLTVGKKADFVLYDLTSLSLLPRTDPIGLLILGRPTDAVDSVGASHICKNTSSGSFLLPFSSCPAASGLLPQNSNF